MPGSGTAIGCVLAVLFQLAGGKTTPGRMPGSNTREVEQSIAVAQSALLHGELDRARDEFTRSLDLARGGNPPDPGAVVRCLVQRGELSFGRGAWDAAESDYLDALVASPRDASALDHLGELRAAQRRFPEAVSLYQEAVAQSNRPEFVQALGDVYEFSGDAEQARLLHARALAGYLERADRGESACFRQLAGFYADVQPDPVEALRWARRAVETSRDASTCDALAWAYYKNGQWAEAAAMEREALASGTRNAHLFYQAGMIFSRAGDLARGGKLLREVTVVNPRYFNTFHVHR